MTPLAHAVSIIVPAAGCGLRMGGAVSKQYLPLLGKSILQHTLEVLLRARPKRLVLVVSKNDVTWKNIPLATECEIVMGGRRRADSVLNGLNAIDEPQNDWVMVHDCVRPCLTVEMIRHLFQALRIDKVGGILAVPVTDTLKQVTQGGIRATRDRKGYYLAQTPQMFRLGLLRHALESAIRQGREITDEASAIEHLGETPKIVPGEQRNFKITRRQDLPLAEFYLSQPEYTMSSIHKAVSIEKDI